jgi:hypothetical protein
VIGYQECMFVEKEGRGWFWLRWETVNDYVGRLYVYSMEHEVHAAVTFQDLLNCKNWPELMLYVLRNCMEQLYKANQVVSAEGGWGSYDAWMWEEAMSLGAVEAEMRCWMANDIGRLYAKKRQ